MLGTSELLEKCLFVFPFFIFLLQGARAVAAGGKGDVGRRPGRGWGPWEAFGGTEETARANLSLVLPKWG